ncbi:MAG: hypothetical protein HY894_02920 [Deltaproteobacteria bacterium]|nr:hypothetical protein [Deltaproteobacteria bacterium]
METMPPDIVITGIGVISQAGAGVDAFWDALMEKRPLFSDIGSPAPVCRGRHSRLGAAAPDIDAVLDDRRFRRAANLSKFAVAAARLAIVDAGLDPAGLDPEETGLVTGVTHGAINFTREFHEALAGSGPAAASPALFSDSVLNAPAGNVSIAFNIRGPGHTVTGDLSTGIYAINMAVKTMRGSGVKVCIAGGAEELDPVVRGHYARLGLLSPCKGKDERISPFSEAANGFVPGEGACFIVLEEREAAEARGARVYAVVSSISGTLKPPRQLGEMGDGVFVSAGANGTYADTKEAAFLKALFGGAGGKPYIGCVKPVVGESFGASNMMQSVAALKALHSGCVPPSMIDGGGASPVSSWARVSATAQAAALKAAVVTTAGFNDGGGVLVLKKP